MATFVVPGHFPGHFLCSFSWSPVVIFVVPGHFRGHVCGSSSFPWPLAITFLVIRRHFVILGSRMVIYDNFGHWSFIFFVFIFGFLWSTGHSTCCHFSYAWSFVITGHSWSFMLIYSFQIICGNLWSYGNST